MTDFKVNKKVKHPGGKYFYVLFYMFSSVNMFYSSTNSIVQIVQISPRKVVLLSNDFRYNFNGGCDKREWDS